MSEKVVPVYAFLKETGEIHQLVRIEKATNGNIDITGVPIAGGPERTTGWWRWWGAGVENLREFAEECSRLEGWKEWYGADMAMASAMHRPVGDGEKHHKRPGQASQGNIGNARFGKRPGRDLDGPVMLGRDTMGNDRRS